MRKLRTSERSAFKRCRFAWALTYEAGMQVKRESSPLRFGTLVHKALEKRYPVGRKRGPHPRDTFVKLFDAEIKRAGPMLMKIGSEEQSEWASARDVGAYMLEEYVAEYGKDERYEVLATEQVFNFLVRDDSGASVFRYVGTLDGVWRDWEKDGRITPQDFKTAASIRTSHLGIDDQASSYLTFAVPYLRARRIIPADAEVDFILFTFLRKGNPDLRPRAADGARLNNDGSVSKKQPAPLFERAMVYRSPASRVEVSRRAIAEFREMEMVRTGKLEVLKSGNGMVCGMCRVRDICETHEIGADWEAVQNSLMQPWDPYSSHEIQEEGREEEGR